MKHSSVITSVLSKVKLPKEDLEDSINHRLRKGRYKSVLNDAGQTSFSPDFEIVQTLSTATPAKGELYISFFNDRTGRHEKLELPVCTSFFVTCLKGKDCTYKLGMSSSLS